MRVPGFEDIKDETEQEKAEEEENDEEDRVSGQVPTEEGYLFL